MFRVLELTPVRKVFVVSQVGKSGCKLCLFQVMNLDANGQEPIPVSPEAQLKKKPHSVDGWQPKKNMIYEQLVDVFFGK